MSKSLADSDTIGHRVLRQVFRPSNMVRKIWARLGWGPFSLRVYFDATERPHFSYCMYHAALQARQLGLDRIAAIEFGVAGGNGLLAMERIAAEIKKETSVEYEIYGFDTGEGMPEPIDYRDLPYVYGHGFFSMDQKKLKERLRRAHLVLGDVARTVPEFFERWDPPPIAFASFDLDYYRSTADALKIFTLDGRKTLPRVFCYFDDIVGFDEEIHCEYVGALLAIKEFNQRNDQLKIAPVYGLRCKRWIKNYWNDMIFAVHDFTHPMYTKYILPGEDRQIRLDEDVT